MKNVMESRKLAKGSLEYFPTPPWATRALIAEIFRRYRIRTDNKRVLDPCCGGGHMAAGLRDYFGDVDIADIADWGIAPPIRDFLMETPDRLIEDGREIPDWIFINPPFEQAVNFTLKALQIAREGVAVFCRLGWLASEGRYQRLFLDNPPTFLCPFAERVALIEAAWDPAARSATDYAWFIWLLDDQIPSDAPRFTTVEHIRPGMKRLYTRDSDLPLASPGEAERRRKARNAESAALYPSTAGMFGDA